MNEIDRRLIDLAARQHQVFGRAQARAEGLSPSALSRRLRRGELVACGTSALHYKGVTLTYRGQLMAGICDLGPDALVSGRAAAALHRLDGFDEGPLEYLVPRSQRGRTTRGLVTSTASIARLDKVTIDGLPCTSGTRTVVDLLSRTDERDAGNAYDSACRMRITAPSVVEERLDELGRQGRSGVAMFERLTKAGFVESWLERRFVALIRRAGLPTPVHQRRYEWDDGRIARVDFDFTPLPVIVEVGGRRGYMSFEEHRRQEQRRNALQLEGKIIYFFSREHVQYEPRYVLATLAKALGVEAVTADCRMRDPA